MKDGGSAFPVLDSICYGDGVWRLDCRDFGMTLRDYFAGQAISGQATLVRFGCKSDAEIAAVTAYQIADAMLAEREKIPAGVKNEL